VSDKFIRSTFILTAGNFIGAVCSYLVHPLLTRYISIAAYGDFQALLSFLAILGIIASVIITTLTKEISVLQANQPAAVPVLRRRALTRLSALGLVLFFLVWLLTRPLNSLFQITEPAVLLISALSLLYIFPLAVNRAALAGLQRFTPLAAVNLAEPVFRLFLIICLAIIWPWGLTGAAWSLGLTSLLALVISFWPFKNEVRPAVAELKVSLRALGPYAVLVLWFTALSQFFYNFDMLLVKSYFSPERAGLYGALLTIGRIIYFVGGSIPLVMFPIIAGLRGDTSLRRHAVFAKSLGLMALLAVPATAIIVIFPEFMIRIVVGAKYLSLIPYLPAFAIAMLLMTLFTVISQYFLALSDRSGLWVLTGGAVLEVILLSLFHTSFWEVIWSLILVFGSINLALLILFLVDYRVTKRNLYGRQN
jgi:O-antigen/teichoic acid export membrane protein